MPAELMVSSGMSGLQFENATQNSLGLRRLLTRLSQCESAG